MSYRAEHLRYQYSTPEKLRIRAQTHRDFTPGPDTYMDELLRHLRLEPGLRLLDVGCGDGFWTDIFVELGLDAAGVDLSPTGVEIAQRRCPPATFAIADAEAPLPFPAESFDVVFSRAISHLVREELLTDSSRTLMANLVRYIRPGGLLLFSVSSLRDDTRLGVVTQHTVSDLLRLVETAADPWHIDVVGNYVQVGAQRRDAPRVRASGADATVTSRRSLPRRLLRAVGRRLDVRRLAAERGQHDPIH